MDCFGRTAGGRWELSLYFTPSLCRFNGLRCRADVVETHFHVKLEFEEQDLGEAVGHEM